MTKFHFILLILYCVMGGALGFVGIRAFESPGKFFLIMGLATAIGIVSEMKGADR